jgi:hypothetical protein
VTEFGDAAVAVETTNSAAATARALAMILRISDPLSFRDSATADPMAAPNVRYAP